MAQVSTGLSEQKDVSECLRLLHQLDLHQIRSDSVDPIFPQKGFTKHGLKEYRTHDALALFLANNSRGESDVAVTSLRVDKRVTAGVRFLAAMTRPRTAEDERAAGRLSAAIQDPGCTVYSLGTTVLESCHLRMEDCRKQMAEQMLSREEFGRAVIAYGKSKSRLSGQPVPTATYLYDRKDGAIVAYKQAVNQPNLLRALIQLYDCISELVLLAALPSVLLLNDLEPLSRRWFNLSAAVSWLIVSDFFERMTCFAELTDEYPESLVRGLVRMRYSCLQVARYDMGVFSLYKFSTRYPRVAASFNIEWVEDQIAPSEPIILRSKALDAARIAVAHADLWRGSDEWGLDDLFGDAKWEPTQGLAMHAEMKLVRHLFLYENWYVQTSLKSPLAIACSGLSCWACHEYVLTLEETMGYGHGPRVFFIQSPHLPVLRDRHLDFQLPGLEKGDQAFWEKIHFDALASELERVELTPTTTSSLSLIPEMFCTTVFSGSAIEHRVSP